MITVKDSELVISIRNTAPQERVQMIIKAIAAAVRWYAHSQENHIDSDGENLTILAELQGDLAEN